MNEFDFGPISRTVDASTGWGDAINFAALPIHEALMALLAATNRNEFVAWLWHDLFKPLFWWPQRTRWFHHPKNKCGDPLNGEARWSAVTGIPPGLVETHHAGRHRKLKLSEAETVRNEFDQVVLGSKARFIQLSFLAEPATHTALLRAVIADAFMEVVTKEVAASIKRELATRSPTFRRVRYVFDFSQSTFSTPPTDSEIAKLAARYSLSTDGDELVIKHLVPTTQPNWEGRHTEVVMDLTAEPPKEERFAQGIISLVELLTVYQDSRTVLMGIPQFLQVDIGRRVQQVKGATEQRLRSLDIRTLASYGELKKQSRFSGNVNWAALPLARQGLDIDLLAHVFAEQVEIRLIDKGAFLTRVRGANGRAYQVRLLSDIVSRSIDLLRGKPRRCRFCNVVFDSIFPAGAAVVGSYFTDVEHVGFSGDICPMCRIYMLNSHKSRTAAERARGIIGDRKGYRGHSH